MTETYTVFCRDVNNIGTTWIGVVHARTLRAAIRRGRQLCCYEWGRPVKNIHVLGVAEGDVKIVYWDDLE